MTVVHREVEGGEGEEGEGKEESTIQRKGLRVEVREGRKEGEVVGGSNLDLLIF